MKKLEIKELISKSEKLAVKLMICGILSDLERVSCIVGSGGGSK